MRSPAYFLLPVLGAVALVAAVLGTWLWPAPTVPSESSAPSAVATPVTTETPRPAPAPLPPPARPVSRPVAAAPAPAPVPPPSAAPMPTEPMAVAPMPPAAPSTSQVTDLSPEARANIQQKWSSLRNRAADLALRGVEQLERQRDEARARGDQAEFERLDTILRTHKERVELMRGAKPEVPATEPAPPPPVQAGPPVE